MTPVLSNQTRTKNKGEWSEFYAFVKILCDKRLFFAEENFILSEDKFFNVKQIIREEDSGKTTYVINNENDSVAVKKNGVTLGNVPLSEIRNEIPEFFNSIMESGHGTFLSEKGSLLMDALFCRQIKASSNKKIDITLILQDSRSATVQELGFSIKSMLNSPSTLLNASGVTNFIFNINNLLASKIPDINRIDKVQKRVKRIIEEGASLEFENISNEVFTRNLNMADTILPKILAELLLTYYSSAASTMQELINEIEKKSLQNGEEFDKDAYKYKIKEFLIKIALGMMPGKPWDGLTDARGGYIIVKNNGEVVCYHLYDRDKFAEYLFDNTKLETPSTGRHEFGDIYLDREKNKIKLNLQIRFIH